MHNDYTTLSPIFKEKYGKSMKDKKKARKEALKKFKDGGRKGGFFDFFKSEDDAKRTVAGFGGRKKDEKEERGYEGGNLDSKVEERMRRLAEKNNKKVDEKESKFGLIRALQKRNKSRR